MRDFVLSKYDSVEQVWNATVRGRHFELTRTTTGVLFISSFSRLEYENIDHTFVDELIVVAHSTTWSSGI